LTRELPLGKDNHQPHSTETRAPSPRREVVSLSASKPGSFRFLPSEVAQVNIVVIFPKVNGSKYVSVDGLVPIQRDKV
jgi:hypothetical protein